MNSITKKLLLIPLMFVFLAVAVSAASVTTSLFYDATNSSSLTITNGDSFGIIVSADSILEASMTINVDLLDSSGNLVDNLLNVFTTSDSYSNFMILDSLIYQNPGIYTIVSTVISASGQSDVYVLNLEVLPVTAGNNPPVITSVAPTEVNETNVYTYQVVAVDADNDPLTYSLTQAPSWLSMSSSGLISGVAPNVVSDYVFVATAMVSDGQDFDLQTFTIVVRDTNQNGDTTAPFITVLSPINNQVYNSNTVLFEISINENTNNAWFVLDGGSNTSMTQISGVSYRDNVSVGNGVHSVVFYAVDLAGNIGQTNAVVFSVNTNVPTNNFPIFTSTPITTVNENTNYAYQSTATDADNDVLTFSLNGPSWLSINSATGLVSGVAPSVTVDTPFNVIVVVSDGNGGVATQSYTLTVRNVQSSGGSSGGRAIGGGSGTRFIGDQDFENQAYLDQFASKPVTEDEASSAASRSLFKLLLVIFGLLCLALLLVLAYFLIKRR